MLYVQVDGIGYQCELSKLKSILNIAKNSKKAKIEELHAHNCAYIQMSWGEVKLSVMNAMIAHRIHRQFVDINYTEV